MENSAESSMRVRPAVADSRTPRYLLLALVLLWGVWAVANYYVNEDAFISFRYVENLVGGEGLVYNPGVRDEAYSNLFWILLLALPTLLGVPAVVSAPALGILCGAATIYLVWLIAKRLTPRRRWAPLAAALVTAAFYPLLVWSGSGLETPLFTLLLTAAALAHLRPKSGRFPWTGLLLGLAAWTRPEGLAFIVVFAFHHWFYRRRGAETGSSLSDLLVVLGLVAAQFLFRRFYYGLWLPLPAYVKAGGSLVQLKYGLGYILFWLLVRAPLLLALPALWGLIKRWRRPAAGLFTLMLAAQFAFIIYAGGDYMAHYRFLVPVMPALVLLALIGGDELLDRMKGERPRACAMWTLTAAFVLWSQLGHLGDYAHRLAAEETQLHNYPKQMVGAYLREVLPDEATLACGSAGGLAYYSDLTLYDFAGLCNAEAALNGEVRHEGMAGHHLAYPELIDKHEPWLVFINPNAVDAEKLGDWLAGETATPGYAFDDLSFPNREMLDHPVLTRDYRPMFARVDAGDAVAEDGELYVSLYARRGEVEEFMKSAGAVPVVPQTPVESAQ